MSGFVAGLGALALLQAVSPGAAAGSRGPPPRPPAPEPTVDELVVVGRKRDADPDWASKFNFDPKGEHERAKTPYWKRPLEGGCRVSTAGVACVRRF